MIGFAIRASFGVFQIPIAEEFGWLRAEFSLAIAIQNLAWGIAQPLFGALAERFGDRKAILLGALTYAAGLVLSSFAGTIFAAWRGKRYSKKYLLASIYMARTVVAAAFILSPITPGSVLLFSLMMGALWLATVPLTSGLIAQIYGLRYMGTLYGIVFFSHQLGSFLGVWLGGELYDIYGDYTLVWWVGVAVGLFSCVVHLPVRERSLNLRPV